MGMIYGKIVPIMDLNVVTSDQFYSIQNLKVWGNVNIEEDFVVEVGSSPHHSAANKQPNSPNKVGFGGQSLAASRPESPNSADNSLTVLDHVIRSL